MNGNGRQPKFAIAGFQHETNTFSPIFASYSDFVRADGWPGLTEGADVLSVFRPMNIPIGGFIAAAEGKAELAPILWASAEPSNLVSNEAFETITAKLLVGIADSLPADGIYLDLHGAMVTERFEDAEGELLRRVRDLAGERMPIAVSLDLHANITEEMADAADIVTVFRTYPHLDMAETGARSFNLLADAARTGLKPKSGLKKLPFMVPIHAQCTTEQPAKNLYGMLESCMSLKDPTADIALGFPPADIAQCGPAIVASGYSRWSVNNKLNEIEAAFVAAADEFRAELAEPDEAVREAIEFGKPGRPAVLADIQDNSGAGATSDTTALLASMVSCGAANAALGALFDPDAAAAAHEAGLGAEFDFALGGKIGGDENPSYEGRFKVAALSDGNFEYTGAMMGGCKAALGPTAALQVVDSNSDVRVVVTSSRVQCLDRAVFSHLGIEPVQLSIVAVKSTVHFRADFEPIASRVILVDAPGCNPCVLDRIDYKRLRPGVRLL